MGSSSAGKCMLSLLHPSPTRALLCHCSFLSSLPTKTWQSDTGRGERKIKGQSTQICHLKISWWAVGWYFYNYNVKRWCSDFSTFQFCAFSCYFRNMGKNLLTENRNSLKLGLWNTIQFYKVQEQLTVLNNLSRKQFRVELCTIILDLVCPSSLQILH